MVILKSRLFICETLKLILSIMVVEFITEAYLFVLVLWDH